VKKLYGVKRMQNYALITVWHEGSYSAGLLYYLAIGLCLLGISVSFALLTLPWHV